VATFILQQFTMLAFHVQLLFTSQLIINRSTKIYLGLCLYAVVGASDYGQILCYHQQFTKLH